VLKHQDSFCVKITAGNAIQPAIGKAAWKQAAFFMPCPDAGSFQPPQQREVSGSQHHLQVIRDPGAFIDATGKTPLADIGAAAILKTYMQRCRLFAVCQLLGAYRLLVGGKLFGIFHNLHHGTILLSACFLPKNAYPVFRPQGVWALSKTAMLESAGGHRHTTQHGAGQQGTEAACHRLT
jgi:hypothetical protein